MTLVPIVVVPAGEISAHDAEVLRRVNAFIDAAYNRGFTVSETLDGAQAMAEGARAGPHDLEGRDAEYYLKCRHEVSTHEYIVTALPVAIGGDLLNVFYNTIKAVMIGAGFEEVMRTDKDVPVTPPGGISWGHKGCMDGLYDDGKARKMPEHARLVTMPSMHVPVTSFHPTMA